MDEDSPLNGEGKTLIKVIVFVSYNASQNLDKQPLLCNKKCCPKKQW